MSEQYDKYLKEHIDNVQKAWNELKPLLQYLPVEITSFIHNSLIEYMIKHHDESKYEVGEYNPYDDYFYTEKTDENREEINKAFAYAWNTHQKMNTHHWQYWVLLNDDGTTKVLDMEIHSILEMFCDWWSFSWKQNNPREILDFYKYNRDKMQLSEYTQNIVEKLLSIVDEKY